MPRRATAASRWLRLPPGPADLPLPRSPAAAGVTDMKAAGREGTARPGLGNGGGGRAAGWGVGVRGQPGVAAVLR